jgi:hypothetical protein
MGWICPSGTTGTKRLGLGEKFGLARGSGCIVYSKDEILVGVVKTAVIPTPGPGGKKRWREEVKI